MEETKTIGQVAFEAWAERCKPPFSLTWHILPEETRESWEEISQAVVEKWARDGH